MDSTLGGILLLTAALSLLLLNSAMAPASLEEIKEAAASLDDVFVNRIDPLPGDPRITFMICGRSMRGVYHCRYTMLLFTVRGGGLLVSEEIVANIGIIKTGSLRADFLNNNLMDWGRSRYEKRKPLPEDEEATLLLENLLGMARHAVRHHLFVSAIAVSS